MDVYRVGPNEYGLVWNPDRVTGVATLQYSDRDDEVFVAGPVVTGLSTITHEPVWVWTDPEEQSAPPKIRSDYKRTWFWRIEHEGGILGPVSIDGKPYGVSVEIARLATRHLKRDIQNEAWLIRKPTYGERCSTCWDDIRGMVTRSNCADCDGTGYERGWGTATHIYASFSNEEPQPEQMPTMRFDQLQKRIWTANTPIVRIGDYILEKNTLNLYEVVRWLPTLHRGFMMRQNIMGRLEEKGGPLYSAVTAILAG